MLMCGCAVIAVCDLMSDEYAALSERVASIPSSIDDVGVKRVLPSQDDGVCLDIIVSFKFTAFWQAFDSRESAVHTLALQAVAPPVRVVKLEVVTHYVTTSFYFNLTASSLNIESYVYSHAASLSSPSCVRSLR